MGQVLYYVLTTGSGQQTLGEEYCDITQVVIFGSLLDLNYHLPMLSVTFFSHLTLNSIPLLCHLLLLFLTGCWAVWTSSYTSKASTFYSVPDRRSLYCWKNQVLYLVLFTIRVYFGDGFHSWFRAITCTCVFWTLVHFAARGLPLMALALMILFQMNRTIVILYGAVRFSPLKWSIFHRHCLVSQFLQYQGWSRSLVQFGCMWFEDGRRYGLSYVSSVKWDPFVFLLVVLRKRW